LKPRAPFARPRSARRTPCLSEDRFGLKPDYLTADSAYGSAENLAWLVKEKKITPHIPLFDKSTRTDGTFSRADFTFDPEKDQYTCPAGKELVQVPAHLRYPTDWHHCRRHTPLSRQQEGL
jgi:hypothetical protein